MRKYVVMMMVLLSSVMKCLGKVHTVGDSAGWALNVDYTTWTSGKSFKLGDSLVFNYGSSHTVDEVISDDYGTCTIGNSIASYPSGPTTIALNSTGTHYFICGVPGHCSGGMKLSVQVTGSGGGGASPAPSTTTPSSSNSTPPKSTTTGNVPASSAVAASPAVAVVLSVVSLMFKLLLC